MFVCCSCLCVSERIAASCEVDLPTAESLAAQLVPHVAQTSPSALAGSLNMPSTLGVAHIKWSTHPADATASALLAAPAAERLRLTPAPAVAAPQQRAPRVSDTVLLSTASLSAQDAPQHKRAKLQALVNPYAVRAPWVGVQLASVVFADGAGGDGPQERTS